MPNIFDTKYSGKKIPFKLPGKHIKIEWVNESNESWHHFLILHWYFNWCVLRGIDNEEEGIPYATDCPAVGIRTDEIKNFIILKKNS